MLFHSVRVGSGHKSYICTCNYRRAFNNELRPLATAFLLLLLSVLGVTRSLAALPRSAIRHSAFHTSAPTQGMGIVFGKTDSKEPDYKILKTGEYDVRQYDKLFVAEISNDAAHEANNSFRELASYIGVFGEPQNRKNSKSEPMSMTSPVLMQEAGQSISMTSPVVSTEGSMSFVLPAHFTSVEDIPVPLNKDIIIKEIPARSVAVKTFSGWYSAANGHYYLKLLTDQLRKDQLLAADSPVQWCVAQYHPPFTIPFLRRNEIWIELKPEAVQSIRVDN